MMRDSRLPCEEYSQRMFRFSHLIIRELIKGLSPNYAICQYFYYSNVPFIVHNGGTPSD